MCVCVSVCLSMRVFVRVCVQSEVRQWQSRRHGEDLAVPAAGVEEHESGHRCPPARVSRPTMHSNMSPFNQLSIKLSSCKPALINVKIGLFIIPDPAGNTGPFYFGISNK